MEEIYDEEIVATVDNIIPPLLNRFNDVFEWPKELLPQRGIEHQIYLKKEMDPVNDRPYRYVHHQKEEMEKLVDEMG